jgi:nitroimidazol reductase NimA-like FMN-containing flavoprotein (pyridoxamine 5'-phosphate oxidase superfamily)
MPSATPGDAPRSERVRVRRKPDRARYGHEAVATILDAGLVAHVGFVAVHGPCVLPMAFARVDDALYLHGATGNAMLRALDGADVCVTVTVLDGLVLARSAFHHSMNYRSVVVFGRATTVTDDDEKRAALAALVDQMVPNRSAECRPPTVEELRATRVVRVPLSEASAKVRTGPPIEDPVDLDPPQWWGGVVPVTTVLGEPQPDEHVR